MTAVRLRGEFCVGFATLLSCISLLLLIFLHVGQINTSTIPRSIAMVKVNTSGYGATVSAFILEDAKQLYTNNSAAPLDAGAGLRQVYGFGFYNYCAYVDDKSGICSNHTTAQRYTPYDIITSDMQFNYSFFSQSFIPDNTTFRSSKYLSESSKAGYYLILLGTICAALALLTGIAKNNLTFFLSSIFSISGTLLLLIGASIWTTIIHKSEDINKVVYSLPGGSSTIPLGITVAAGKGLYLTWGAFICMFLSIIPYVISCCTYRG
ncbi:actin cortical patch SUR7/pH-response regulator pali [Crepidotus variabilis]|uniref:Actin cortical patch SUR7/pH-response regulator pali n=1 Tax=Crepidotus variabilis TaxID=179855 RepID=A0A9P6JX81_9AGAR|nr:actin cortical patch SUR7/pH-response regulator pali [Crepidotus variabilis]